MLHKVTHTCYLYGYLCIMIFVCNTPNDISRALLLVRAGDKLYYPENLDFSQTRNIISSLESQFKTERKPPEISMRKGVAWLAFHF